MSPYTDDQIDLFAQTLCAGFHSDTPPAQGTFGGPVWGGLSTRQRGNWRRAARALLRHIYAGQPVNKAPHHMSEDETDLIGYCDEYEAVRNETGRLADATAELCAHRIAEHFELIRRAVHTARSAA